MKGIFTFFILIVTCAMNAQQVPADLLSGINPQKKVPYTGPSFKTGTPVLPCMSINLTDLFHTDAVLVVDGIIQKPGNLSQLNPKDITSVEILKESSSGAILGCWSARKRVVIITTVQQIVIRDAVTGEGIPLATIYITSPEDKFSSIADENGKVRTDKLKRNAEYTVAVSSVGYKTLSTTVTRDTKELLVEREIKVCEEVLVVVFPPCVRRRSVSCGYSRVSDCSIETITRTDSIISSSVIKSVNGKAISVYPNPVQRNNPFNIEFINEKDELFQLSVSGLNGNRFLLQSYKAIKGLNRFSMTADARWAAGIYIIRVQNEKGVVVRNEKLVIQ